MRRFYSGRIPHKKVTTKWGTFDSELESTCFEQKVVPLIESGVASNWMLHTSFEIIPKLVKQVVKQLKTKTKIIERVEEQNAVYTCDFQYDIEMSNGIRTYIVEFKSKYTKKESDYILRRKLIKHKISQWNNKEGWDKWFFVEYTEKDLTKPPKKERVKKSKKN